MQRTFFSEKSECDALVTSLQNWNAKVEMVIKNHNDNAGNSLSMLERKVSEIGLKNNFSLTIPIFQGYSKQKFTVEIGLDPPYAKDTRYKGQKTRVYKHELADSDHSEICEVANTLEGMVILSGYDNQIYNDLLEGWEKVSSPSFADGARERTEVLWMNKNVARKTSQLKLYA